jgi:hypothetical protein
MKNAVFAGLWILLLLGTLGELQALGLAGPTREAFTENQPVFSLPAFSVAGLYFEQLLASLGDTHSFSLVLQSFFRSIQVLLVVLTFAGHSCTSYGSLHVFLLRVLVKLRTNAYNLRRKSVLSA